MRKLLFRTLTLMLVAVVWSIAFADGAYFTVSRTLRPDPLVFDYISGGHYYVGEERDSRDNWCDGFIAGFPDHIMAIYDSVPYLRMFVESDGDTTLYVHNPRTGEVYCDDDGYGNLQPELELFYLQGGEWHIYVGSYWDDEWHDYSLHVTQFRRDLARW